ncbi:hypothetical protein [Curtobacterium aurantiacum]|uniref:Uncharacterized protein n=1 Tax=Curtobacterium aurantiacum TaxID=3236919 RepID=A0ABS5VHZ3_9MICO|nr:hypothetical protein [Curtobacterium flaccumfaciens]MBT1545864.1 hypothetical protein [Curtobacterium flaccumfaciens pv. flaccumfaciens]MBT1588450.1 hypothetical protein [Curtobacterium flaccumfaciens pv. flaccumfaciens]
MHRAGNPARAGRQRTVRGAASLAAPAAAPELVAATEFARASHAPPTIRRTQMRAGAWIAGVPIAALVVVAIVQILLPR